jgi:RNA polymerase sigma factor (sigma-70 family)
VLVRRHGPLVWGVCRNLLSVDADAEDAFQATFLALVRSAAGIRRTESLAGWLHGVAYRVALKARRAAARRRKREAAAGQPEPYTPVPDAAWEALQEAVHAEVCRLPDRLRLPFVLCGLQGRPQREVAALLGWQPASVSARLAEARRVLVARLARRGVPAVAAVLGGAAGQAAVPAALRQKVLAAAGDPAAVPSHILTLAHGVVPMTVTRTKLLAAVVLAGLLTTSVGVLSRAGAQAPPGPPAEDAVRQYREALRGRVVPKDRWEYKFIPVDRPLTAADLRQVLAAADQDGWAYCGSQDLAQERTGKATPHMVFKRPAAGGAAAGARADVAAAVLAELTAREAAARDRAEAEGQLRRAEAQTARKWADEKAAAEAASVARELEAAAARQHQAEQAVKEAARLRAREAERDAADKARDREVEQLRALVRQLQAELKAKAADLPARPGVEKK